MSDQEPMMAGMRAPLWPRRIAVACLLGALLVVGFIVIRPFVLVVIWAAILTYVAWPLHLRVLGLMRGHRAWAALVMTVALTLGLGIALLWLGMLLRGDLVDAFREAAAWLRAGVQLPEAIASIPWLGPWLHEHLAELAGDGTTLSRRLSALADQWSGQVLRIVGDLGVNALLLGVSLVTAFFLFRDGDRLLERLRRILQSLLGERVHAYFKAVGDTTQAVVYGLLLGAFAQGVLAGLGYWAVGVLAPVFWGIATAVIALIPFGAPLVWGSIGLWLVIHGKIGAGVGLLLWGALAVSWIDNLVRPLVISGVAKIPFLLVLFGVLGGLAAFGLIGLFVGPVVLAVLLAIWREWAAVLDPPPQTN